MEYLDICGENGLPVGGLVEREAAHRDGILHRTAHVWIVRELDGKHQVLLQKRSLEKDSFPGRYDTSSAGHIPAGMEPLPSALRELREELGLQAEPGQLHYAGQARTRYETVFHGRVFRDNEIIWIYVYREPVELASLRLQKAEVETVDWFDLDELRAEIVVSRERFCVPDAGLDVLCRYLESGGAEKQGAEKAPA